ncbi:hypothetical protein BC835DRAFT_1307957 [Cytidiella melzeri]|nr:hypothetical protein BC835DRAFT_1307957 [Cytidiella melzeri]
MVTLTELLETELGEMFNECSQSGISAVLYKSAGGLVASGSAHLFETASEAVAGTLVLLPSLNLLDFTSHHIIPDSTENQYLGPLLGWTNLGCSKRVGCFSDHRPSVIQFVADPYGQEAHRVSANQGLSPVLHYYGPGCSDLYVVVMVIEESMRHAYRLRGQGFTRACFPLRGPQHSALMADSATGATTADAEIIDPDMIVMLADYDSYGLVGKGRYTDTFHATDILWSEGVVRGGIVTSLCCN